MSGVWDATRPELDTEPPRDPRLPVTSYIVCSTPRSGSGLLCRGLASTGMGGTPAEYFNPNQRLPLSARWQTGDDLHAFARALRARRTSAAGVFGIKLHWNQLELVQREAGRASFRRAGVEEATALLDELFPGSAYVQITRTDVDRQAVSLWTALHTGVWSAKAGAPPETRSEVPYSFSGIHDQRVLISRENEMWAQAFERAGIEPIVVVYEDLVAAYRQTIVSVLVRATGRQVPLTDVPEPDSRRQGDDPRSEELLALFRRDLARGAPRRLTRLSELTKPVREKIPASARFGAGSG